MGNSYEATQRAEEGRKWSPQATTDEPETTDWKALGNDRGLSRWRHWVGRRENEARPARLQETFAAGLIDQLASLEFTVGALDDQLARELPETEQRLRRLTQEGLHELEERLSERIASAADAAARRSRQLTRQMTILFSVILVALFAILSRL